MFDLIVFNFAADSALLCLKFSECRVTIDAPIEEKKTARHLYVFTQSRI